MSLPNLKHLSRTDSAIGCGMTSLRTKKVNPTVIPAFVPESVLATKLEIGSFRK